MSASYNRRRAKAISEAARLRATRGWEVRRARMAETPREPELRPVPAGEFILFITVQFAHGEVKRLIVRQGARANQIRVDGMCKDHGWDYITQRLRSRLAVPRRVLV
jgi:hypothetical protein